MTAVSVESPFNDRSRVEVVLIGSLTQDSGAAAEKRESIQTDLIGVNVEQDGRIKIQYTQSYRKQPPTPVRRNTSPREHNRL